MSEDPITEQAAEIAFLQNVFRAIDYLRNLTDASIEIFAYNEEAESIKTQAKVTVRAWYTEWDEQDYLAESWCEALFAAEKDAREAEEAAEKQRRQDQQP